jgi:hypothetical protein
MRAAGIQDLIQVETPEGTQDAVEEAANHDSRTTAGRGVGRPSKYSEELASEICRLLSEGESLRQICERQDMPARSTVNKWLAQKREFADQYALARERQADFYADEMVHLADTAEDVNKARLQIDTRKWVAAKLLPKKYNDRLVTEHVAGGDARPMDPVELAQRVAAMLAEHQKTTGSEAGEEG